MPGVLFHLNKIQKNRYVAFLSISFRFFKTALIVVSLRWLFTSWKNYLFMKDGVTHKKYFVKKAVNVNKSLQRIEIHHLLFKILLYFNPWAVIIFNQVEWYKQLNYIFTSQSFDILPLKKVMVLMQWYTLKRVQKHFIEFLQTLGVSIYMQSILYLWHTIYLILWTS